MSLSTSTNVALEPWNLPADIFACWVQAGWTPGRYAMHLAGDEIGDWEGSKKGDLAEILRENRLRLETGRIAGMCLLSPSGKCHVFLTVDCRRKLILIGWGADCPQDSSRHGLVDIPWAFACLRELLSESWSAITRITFEVV